MNAGCAKRCGPTFFGPAAFTEKCTGFDSPWVFCASESESVSPVGAREIHAIAQNVFRRSMGDERQRKRPIAGRSKQQSVCRGNLIRRWNQPLLAAIGGAFAALCTELRLRPGLRNEDAQSNHNAQQIEQSHFVLLGPGGDGITGICRGQNTRTESNPGCFLLSECGPFGPELPPRNGAPRRNTRPNAFRTRLTVFFRHSRTTKLMQEIHRLTDN